MFRTHVIVAGVVLMADVANTDEQAGDPHCIEVEEDLKPLITFKVRTQKNWKSQDLLNNEVKMVGLEHQPACIKAFRDKLIEKRHVTDKIVTVGTLGICMPLSDESLSSTG